ncbi:MULTISPECIES: phage tail terminator protein [Pseudoalteromonas]|uniref:Phage tail protein n=1 Tax=Pseudoalteromonas amylolytica TaxID=1859457 RepID=A0A1S1MXG1_9GAMM|nr:MULTISPECIES: hypothetical protein [Pseudoalteromonas]OHU85525.1 hypothetical protein BFC16_19445 [Pseudoalteromonas sp. JW3]OHU91759.1 hypothetical protein BET10_08140 [Pseudoalteromonas amylolytica]
MFNFDLNHIENALKRERIANVGMAADFNEARKRPVQSPQLYVLPLDEDYDQAQSITGQDEYTITEIFAVMIVIPCIRGNKKSDEQIKQLRGQVKQAIAGLTFKPWQPIQLHRGRIVELNHATNNLIYQCQFKVTGHITVTTKAAL